jgi:hypothetical protein
MSKKKTVTTRVIPRHLSHLICTSAPALMSSYTTGSRVAAAAWCSGVRPFSVSTADMRVAGGCKASGLSPVSSSTACPPPSPPLPARAGLPTPLRLANSSWHHLRHHSRSIYAMQSSAHTLLCYTTGPPHPAPPSPDLQHVCMQKAVRLNGGARGKTGKRARTSAEVDVGTQGNQLLHGFDLSV